MKSKRLMAAILTVGLVLAILPLPSMAADPGKVEYNRLNPEVSILNRYTGSSNKYYEGLMSDGSFYNAIDLFTIKAADFNGNLSGTQKARYSDKIAYKTLVYEGFENSVIKQLSMTHDNLKANTSATFHNHFHKHKVGWLTYDLIAFSRLQFLIKGDYTNQNLYGRLKPTEANPRLGNGQFSTVNSSQSDEMKLIFFGGHTFFAERKEVCDCQGHYATNTVVAFMDDRAPRLNGVVFKDADGKIVTDGSFGAGAKITIVVAYDEPIRFADDENKHDDLYINLQISGVTPSSYPKAYLKKLDTDALYFEYEVPNESGLFQKITGVDLSPLMKDNLILRQLYKGTSLNVIVPSDAPSGTTGFTTTTAYITDLAGNAITEKTASRLAYIDTRAFGVDKIKVSSVTNNEDVKEALNKTNPDDSGYLDNSDIYMGVGDSITVSLVMNKEVKFEGLATAGARAYVGLEVETNWKYANGETCTINSQWASTVSSASVSSASKEQLTEIIMKPLTILPGMYCDDGYNKPLKITKINYKSAYHLYDQAGNEFEVNNFSGDKIEIPVYYIDTEVPELTTTADYDGDGDDKIHKVTSMNSGTNKMTFRFPFTVTDASSGVEELNGGFCWYKEGSDAPFEYAVKAQATFPINEGDWQEGTMGEFYEFTQTGTEQYLFIRPVDGQEYDVYDTEIQFYAKDYAGNAGAKDFEDNVYSMESPLGFKIDALWDDLVPTAKAGNVKRSVNESGGWTLAVDVLLNDHAALDNTSVYYGWIDQEPSDPVDTESIGNNVWVSAPFNYDEDTLRSGTAKATAEIDPGTHFSRHLVVKAKDKSGNESVTYLGKYECNLTAIDYALGYSSAITSEASLKIEEIDDDGALLFMVKDPDHAYPNDYFICLYMDTEDDNGSDNIFSQERLLVAEWARVGVTQSEGAYYFDIGDEYDISFFEMDYIDDIIDYYTFCGEIPVTVLAGHKDAFEMDEKWYYGTPYGLFPVKAAGFSVEELVLRMTGSNAPLEKTFTGMGIGTDAVINTKYDPGFWEKGQAPMLSTAEGIKFNVDLGKDVNGWNFEDVDYAKSYVELKTGSGSSAKSYKAYLSSSPEQTVAFPKGDYPTGYYDVSLSVVCKAGKGYTVPLGSQMYIDNTPAVQNFGITSLSYAVKNYQNSAPWHDVDGTINYLTNTDVIYLPVNSSGVTDIENIMKVETEQVTGFDLPATYAVRAWNATAGVTAANADYSITKSSDLDRSFMFIACDDAAKAAAKTGTTTIADGIEYTNIGLIKNQPNTIAVQVLNANGKESSIRYYVIQPVDEEVEGTLSVTQGDDGSNIVPEGNLIFTAAEGRNMLGTGLYVSVGYYQSGILTQKADLIRQEMLPQGDGTYIYPLLPGKEGSESYVYSVYAIDSYGNLTMFGELDTAVVDQEAPSITMQSGSESEGLYEAKFKVKDDTLNAVNFQGENNWSRLYKPMIISLSFDKNHAEWLGIHENTSLDLTLNENAENFGWESTGSSETGIYEVRAERKKVESTDPDDWDTPYYLEVTVKGVVGYKEGDDPQTFSLIMDAADALGNTTRASAEFTNPTNVKPVAITGGAGAPAYVATHVAHDKALKLTFNSPVLPEVSWICPEPKYGMEQTDAFPITSDGTWTITYSDIFGNTYQQDLTLTDVFKEYGLDLSMSPTELTTDPVNLSVSTVEMDTTGTVLVFRKTESGGMEPVTDIDGDWNTPSQEKKIKVEESQTLIIMHYLGEYPNGDRLEVNISNIIKGAPEAKPHFYFEAIGTEYSLDTLPKNAETHGNVLVWYSTSRNVIPRNDTGSTYTFKRGGETGYTFDYVDDFGYEGSLTVNLGDWGITLTEPPAPGEGEPVKELEARQDETAPHAMVTLNAKRFGTYRPEESFGDYSDTDAIKDSFDAVSFVQGYLLVVDAYDESSYKIVVKESTPNDITYATAANDEITGVKVVGNTIALSRAADFTIVVVDNAAAESGAPADNFTSIELKAADMKDWFDTTKPTAVVSGVWDSLYQKTFYIELRDATDTGIKTPPAVTLDSPKLEKETDPASSYKDMYKRVFTANDNEHLVFYDFVGNMGTEDFSVDKIDETMPVVTTTWSPHYINPSDPLDMDPYSPPTGPLNTNVIAMVSCNTNMKTVKAEYSGDGGNTWIDGPVSADSISYKVTSDQIIVTFSDTQYRIRLTVTAPNGKTATETILLGDGVIDKSNLSIANDVAYQYRTDSKGDSYTEPYAAKITLKPGKLSYCLNAGQRTTLYGPGSNGSGNDLVITTDTNETKVYKFVDQAGNPSEVTVTTSGIDTTPPKITVDSHNTTDLVRTSTSVDIKITSNEDGTAECQKVIYDLSAGVAKSISFTENGVYIIKVFDKAGNSDSISVVVGNIDKVAPTISFDKLTLSIRQGSTLDDLKALLNDGVRVWDNIDVLTDQDWTYKVVDNDSNDIVRLNIPGLYPVTYTATDKAGNEGEAVRYVKVMDKDLPVIIIDGDKLTEPEGTTILSLGNHTLGVAGLKEIASGIMEPYTLKIRRGIVTEGQMKYYSSTVMVDANGKFAINQEGFYTMYIITQSRQSYRTLLYVER